MYNSSNVDNQLVFLINKWNQMYSCKNYIQASKIFKIIGTTLNGISNNSYPRYQVFNYSISVNFDTVVDCSSYNEMLKQVNLLIWAISKAHHNKFGLFMAEWNFVMSLERNHASSHRVMVSIRKYHGNYSNFADWHSIDNTSYQEANNILVHDALSKIMPNNASERYILNYVEHHAWINLVNNSSRTNNNSVTQIILHNASKIASTGTNDIAVQNYLKHFNILTGAKLQNKLVRGISYNSNFKSARGYAIAISKITNPKSMFYFNKQNPWNIHRVSGNEIVKVVNIKKNAKKHYQKLLNTKSKVNSQLEAIKNKFQL